MKQGTLCDYEIVGSGEEGSPHGTFMSRASSARELVVRLRNIHNQPPPQTTDSLSTKHGQFFGSLDFYSQ